ncbi:MAG: efflux RND transporter periplasmic adaptor subunit [bacterium]
MSTANRRRIAPKAWATIGAALGLIAMFAWLEGTFSGHRIGPEDAARTSAQATLPAGAATVRVVALNVPRAIEAPGTVRSRSEAGLAPRIQAAVREVLVNPGDRVEAGQVLVRLDARDTTAKLSQAQAALASAQAEAERVQKDAARVEQLFAEKAATPQQLDQARAALEAARAAATGAARAVDQARVFSAEAELVAPFAGVVVERRVDPGALAAPGVPLLVVIDPDHLRVEATVGEDAARSLALGSPATVMIDGERAPLAVTVDEIVPAADPRTRTVIVKAAIPAGTPVRSGTFARLVLAGAADRVLAVPERAVRAVGQVQTVRVATAERGMRVLNVRVGRRGLGPSGDLVEILAGLAVGDEVVVGGSES